jgi:hypothetical protein
MGQADRSAANSVGGSAAFERAKGKLWIALLAMGLASCELGLTLRYLATRWARVRRFEFIGTLLSKENSFAHLKTEVFIFY